MKQYLLGIIFLVGFIGVTGDVWACVNSITGTATVCQGSTTNLSDATTGGTWASGNTFVATVGTSGTVTGVLGGTATISYTDPASCVSTMIVTVNALPTITSTSPDTRCGTGTLNLGATASAGTINWYTASTGGVSVATGTSFTTPSISSTTTYWVDATSIGCTTATRSSVVATVNIIPTITSTSPDTRCGTGTLNLGATASAGTINWYTASTGGASIATGTSFTTPSISSTTTYWVDATSIGCTTATRSSVIATVNIIPTITSTSPDTRCGTGILNLGATASAGTVNWYSANTGGASIATGTSFATPSISTTTTYWVDATNTGCTTATRSSVIAIVNIIPTITGTTPNARCSTGTVILGATASAGTINWYVASTGGAAIATGTSFTTPSISTTTTYWVDATNIGCTTLARSSVTATVTTVPAITSTTPNSRCGTGTVNLGATASAGTINWYTASIGGASLASGTSFTTPSISSTTTYWVDATITGCTTAARSSVVATVNTIPTITSTSPDTRCGAGSLNLGATASAGTINWYTASTGGSSIAIGTSFATPSVSSTTTYWVDATSIGCTTATRSAVVANVNPIPSITGTTPNSICGTGTVILGATASAGTVNWYTASTGGASIATGTLFNTPSISSTTTYWVDATNSGCTTASRTSVVATVNTIPTITGTTPAARCGAGTVNLAATASAGIVNWYAASSGGSSLTTSTSFTTPFISSTTTYWVDATNSGCTTATRTAVVAIVNPLPAAISGTLNVCLGLTTTLVNGTTGGTWSSSNTLQATVNLSTGIAGGVSAGTPIITYMLSATGCFVTTPLIVNPIPAVITGTMAVCSGLTTQLNDAATGGTWISSNTSVATVITATGLITGIGPGGTASITYTLPTGCLINTTVTVNPLPSAITGTTNVCVGLTTTLNSTPAVGTWSSSDNTKAGIGASTGVVTGVSPGNTIITYTLPTSCIVTAPFTVNPLPVSITENTPVCSGLTTQLSDPSTGGTWSSSNTGVAAVATGTGLITGIGPGTATIIYKLPTGCLINAIVTVNPLPAAPAITSPLTLPAGTILCQGSMCLNFSVSSTPGLSYSWSATGDSILAGKNKSNCLVNIFASSNNVVTATVTINSTGCKNKKDTIITVPAKIAPHQDTVISFESNLLCLQSGMGYQWGYDDTATLLPTALTGETSQNYSLTSPKPGVAYWVITTDLSTSCYQKSYWSVPPGNKILPGNNNGGTGAMKVYPNPAGSYLNVDFDNIENNTEIKIVNLLGKEIMILPLQSPKTEVDISGLQPSVYFIECYHNGVKMADSRFIKN